MTTKTTQAVLLLASVLATPAALAHTAGSTTLTCNDCSNQQIADKVLTEIHHQQDANNHFISVDFVKGNAQKFVVDQNGIAKTELSVGEVIALNQAYHHRGIYISPK
ncbi:hypothetical protein [Shewanella marina]|uniref:hypothetical protein n=1 Tax=Shewanella marina TaxID=487319 RepID=UPI0004722A66|nr:hypothetical protein [Shewanella marina]